MEPVADLEAAGADAYDPEAHPAATNAGYNALWQSVPLESREGLPIWKV
jgi:hypothetical protein